RRLIELHRGYADIHDDTVDSGKTLGGANAREVGETVFHQRQPSLRLVDQIETAGDRRAIAVDSNDAAVLGVKDRTAVAACPEGRIDIDAAGSRIQQRDHLAEKDR